MSVTTAKKPDISVPSDDGRISEALSALDARLKSWSTAMRDAQGALAAQASRLAALADQLRSQAKVSQAVPPPQSPVDVKPAAKPAEAPAAETRRDKAPDAPKTPAPAKPKTETPRKAAETLVVEKPAKPEPKPPAGERPAKPGAGRAAADAKKGPPAAPPIAPDDDEELLASLEPEVADAIRVMRRMSPVKRSVREFLAEYEAANVSASEKKTQHKKTWWSRGKR